MDDGLEAVIYQRRWVDGIKDGALVTDAAIAEVVREHVRATSAEAWEKGMADAKLQALGIRPTMRNPYLLEYVVLG